MATGSGLSDFVIARSALVGAATVVFSEALLLAVIGSVVPLVTLALLVIVPAVDGAVTRIVRFAEAPIFRLPILQVTVPDDSLAEPVTVVAD